MTNEVYNWIGKSKITISELGHTEEKNHRNQSTSWVKPLIVWTFSAG